MNEEWDLSVVYVLFIFFGWLFIIIWMITYNPLGLFLGIFSLMVAICFLMVQTLPNKKKEVL